MSSFSDKNIIDSWLQNAKPWVSAIQNEEIESRTLITNGAIVSAILDKEPQTVLDIGCGEGWLARELSKSGIVVQGLDIVPELIEEANKLGGATYRVMSYEEISQERIKERFDVVVCNFSLIGKASVTNVFQNVGSLLNEGGCFIVQTLHPIAVCGDGKYEDGWREGSWKGFSENFTDPPPWYFRTMESWEELYLHNGFERNKKLEPINPKTDSFASVIFVGGIDGANT